MASKQRYKFCRYFLLGILILAGRFSSAQAYELLLKNGIVIDPAQGIHAKMDLAIASGKIAAIARHIPVNQAKQVIDVNGLLVVPGLIDLHTHVFVGCQPEKFADGQYSVAPDDFSFRSGVTTMVDAGTSGWQNFPKFKSQVIDHSQTRILAFLNIAANGLSGKPEQEDTAAMQPASAVQVQRKYPDIIVGFKIGHFEQADWSPFDKTLEAATDANLPMLVECHLPQYTLQDQLGKMRAGDIITHSFEEISERLPIIDSTGTLRPFVKAAQERGIIFDLGHGGAGFWFSQAIPAFRQGLAPNTFGSDLHRFSMNAGMKSLLNIMSKYLAIGMSLDEVIKRATANPAKAIHREDLGQLRIGTVADIAVLSLQKGKFGFLDAGGNKLEGTQKLEAELTIRAGKIMWDLNGRAAKNTVKLHL
jgi:dihydroorotase